MKDIAEELRRVIASDERTHYRLAIDAGVTPEVIDRFVSGERDIRLATAAKLAAALGLQLTSTKRSRQKA